MSKNKILADTVDYVESKLETKKFIPGKSYIPVSGPQLIEKDVASLVEVALDMWYTEHRKAHNFKDALKKATNGKFVSLTNSGSSASLVAMSALVDRIPSKKEYVVTTALGFPTTIAPIYQNRKVPYFIDVDQQTLAPDMDQLDAVLSGPQRERIAGVLFTHTMGFPFDEWKVQELKWKHKDLDIFVMMDCCDALGASFTHTGSNVTYKVGETADVSTYSFFPAHQVFAIEGGAVVTHSEELHKRVESYINWGRSCWCAPGQNNTCGKRFCWQYNGKLPQGWDHKYIFDRLGYNLKSNEFSAALGLSQIQRLEEFTKKRYENYNRLGREIVGIDKDRFLRHIWHNYGANPSPFGLLLIVDPEAPFTTQEIVDFLETNKVGTRRLFGGNLTHQPAFMGLPYRKLNLDNTDYLEENSFWIGCHPSLTKEMLDYVVEVFEKFYAKYY